MAVSPVLVIKLVEDSGINVRARLYDDFAEHEIVLNSVLTYWWANNMPPATKFLELFDSVIKRTINEIMPHKTLDKASDIGINLLSVSADGVGFKIENGSFSLKGIRKVEPDFESKEFSATYDHVIETPDIVLKKYNEMKK